MIRTIRKLMVWMLFACLLLSSVAAAAETGSISLNMREQPESQFPDPNKSVTFELYLIAKADGASAATWSPAIEGLKLPEAPKGSNTWSAEDVATLEESAQQLIEKNGVKPVDTKTVEYEGSVTFDGLEPGIYMGIAADKPARLTVKPFTVSLPSLSQETPYALKVEPKIEYETPAPTDISVEKVWRDAEDKDKIQPDSITVELYRKIEGGEDALVDTKVIEEPEKEGDNWIVSFDDLPDSDADMKPYIYSVKENPVPEGYTAEVGGKDGALKIINTHTPERGYLKITKQVLVDQETVVETAENAAEVEAEILKYVGRTFTFHVTGPTNASYPQLNNQYTAENPLVAPITVNEKGVGEWLSGELVPGTYTVTEMDGDLPEGMHIVGQNGVQVQVTKDNTASKPMVLPFQNVQSVGSLNIQKSVTVNGGEVPEAASTVADGTFSFTITKAGDANFSRTVEVKVEGGKSETVRVDNLVPGNYTVREAEPGKSGMALADSANTTIHVTAGNSANIPTAEFTNDQKVGSLRIIKRVTRNNGNTSSTDVDGTYRFDITGPDGYTNTVSIRVTNGRSNSVVIDNLPLGNYTVKEQKTNMPTGVVYVSGDEENKPMTAEHTHDNPLTFTFTNNRTVTPPPYTPSNPTPVPTDTPEPTPTPTPTPTPPPVTSVSGRKVWNDEGNIHRTRPSSITVQLLADGVVVQTRSVSGRGNTWSFSFNNLPKLNDNGDTINYSLLETVVSGYTTTVSGNTITNDLIPSPPKEYTSISGTKTWVDDNNEDGSRPNYITVRLLRDGTEVERRTVTAATGWQYSFNDIPVDDGYGNIYTYTIREDGVPGYFGRVVGNDLVNTLLPPPPEQPPAFEQQTEEELEGLVDLFDYGTPLFGELLKTGDDTPIYPFIFGGIGGVALIALFVLLILGKRKKGSAN